MLYRAETLMFRAIQEHEMTDIPSECLCFWYCSSIISCHL